MTTMTNFSATAERIGKTTSEKKAVEAMANALGSVENAIADGDTHYEGHCFIDDAEQYASEGLDSLDKRTLNHISDERINELVHEVALTFDYLEEYNEPATSPEANNDEENAMTAPQTSVFIPSSAASMSFEDFIIGIKIYETKKEVEVSKVNKKSFIASGIKFSLWKVTDKDSCGLRRKDGKKRAIFTSPSRIDGIVEIEF